MYTSTSANPASMVMSSRSRPPRRSALGVYVIALGVAISSAAGAQRSLISEAEQLLTSGNAKQAFVLLAGAQGANQNNPDFDLLLGKAALDSGKHEDAIIALERVLAAKPNNHAAMLELGRAYFLLGSLDLAATTFNTLKRANPPQSSLATIERYLNAIGAQRSQGQRKVSIWGETQLGYDSNLTAVPADFVSAVRSAFNLGGVAPTGNAVYRKAPFLTGAVGGDVRLPMNAEWSLQLGGEARLRRYREESLFNSKSAEARGALIWSREQTSMALNVGGSTFQQRADAPGSPPPSNDRTTGNIGAEFRFAAGPQSQVSAGVTSLRVRFDDNKFEDFNATQITAGWLRQFGGAGAPFLHIVGHLSRDRAVNNLPDGADKSKRIRGIRGYYQQSVNDKTNFFTTLGLNARTDDSAFARATEVRDGKDSLVESAVGMNFRFNPQCTMRAQWQLGRNDSNVAIYDYTRHEVSSTVRCDFY